MRLYLDVPYQEKEEAKALGAKWDARVRKWYTDVFPPEYVRFAKWLLRDRDQALIATEYIYLLDSQRPCFRCGRPTNVVGLGVGEFFLLSDDGTGPRYEFFEDRIDPGEEIHLAWTEDEDDIPPKLLDYIKRNYPVRTGFSKTLGRRCFANHCQHCGAMQGNWFLFQEPDSPLSSDAFGQELEERMQRLRIKQIPIEDNLLLRWDVSLCSNDHAYMGAPREELILAEDPEEVYVTYGELYS